MNGYRVKIFEQDTRPGGLVTAWERKGYTIHGNMAFVAGSGPGVPGLHRIWRELGVVPAVRFVDYEHLLVIEGRDGETLEAPADLDRFERVWKERAPGDAKAIDALVRGARTFASYDLPVDKPRELMGPADMMKIMLTRFPLLRAMSRGKKTSVLNFASRFKTPLLRDGLVEFSRIFSEDLPLAFLQLALELEYRARVVKILVRDGRAVGVRLADGREFPADDVISAGDGRTTIFEMLEGKFVDAAVRGHYERLPVAPCTVIVGFGVDRTFPELPWSAVGRIILLGEPVTLGGREFRSIRPMVYNFDPSLAPPGKTFVRLYLPEAYRAEKEAIVAKTTSLLDRRFRGFASQVEMTDVATPLTFERYSGNWKASSLGWDATTRTLMMPMKKTLPGLEKFHMAGQWVEPGGGLPMVAASGRSAVQLLCRRDGRPFRAEPA
jgi:phytoene dehydrogenase-like protein